MSKRRAKFKIGDTVRVDHPLHVVRVGYPKTIDDYLEAAEPHALEAVALLQDRGVWRINKHRMARDIAASLARQDGFGGTSRSIHAVLLPEFQGEARVTGIRYCKTGQHVSAWDGGEDGYEPAYLSDAKTRRLLVVEFSGDPFQWIETEDVNVTLVSEVAA